MAAGNNQRGSMYYRLCYDYGGTVIYHDSEVFVPPDALNFEVNAVSMDCTSPDHRRAFEMNRRASYVRYLGDGAGRTVDVSIPDGANVSLSVEPLSAGCVMVDPSVGGERVGCYLSLSGANPDAERLALGLYHAKLKVLLPGVFDPPEIFRLVELTRLPLFVSVRLRSHKMPGSVVSARHARLPREGKDDVEVECFERLLANYLFAPVFQSGRRRR